jgi:hypothetical protein
MQGHHRGQGKRLDMGKTGVRLRELDGLPIELIAEAIARSSIDA